MSCIFLIVSSCSFDFTFRVPFERKLECVARAMNQTVSLLVTELICIALAFVKNSRMYLHFWSIVVEFSNFLD